MSFRTKKIREFAPRVVLPYRKRYQQDGKNKPAEIARAKRVCKKFNGQGDMAMLGCFQQNKVRLSRSCSKFLTSIGQLH
jgi:hypothetical protein